MRAGVLTLATECHHVISIRRLRQMGREDLRLDRSNLMPLCGRCHDAREREKCRQEGMPV